MASGPAYNIGFALADESNSTVKTDEKLFLCTTQPTSSPTIPERTEGLVLSEKQSVQPLWAVNHRFIKRSTPYTNKPYSLKPKLEVRGRKDNELHVGAHQECSSILGSQFRAASEARAPIKR
jgi:hypothetical protein